MKDEADNSKRRTRLQGAPLLCARGQVLTLDRFSRIFAHRQLRP